jgi:cytochrome c553
VPPRLVWPSQLNAVLGGRMAQRRGQMNSSGVRSTGVALAALLSFAVTTLAQASVHAAVLFAAREVLPSWAYPWDPDFRAHPADDVLRRVPSSDVAFSFAQVRDLFLSPDWHPSDHPAMPEIVARGRKPDVYACGSCHRAEGTGGPENASLASLPPSYISQQMADFKSGARSFSGPQRLPVLTMIALAKAATAAEGQAAAEYFSALKPKRNIRVVEADTVPRSAVAGAFFVPSGNGSEPLRQRILEVPVDVDQFELRDSRAQFVAYVPVGSIASGRVLVETGGAGVTVPCAVCHGADLKGIGPIPGIAGRSPSYVVRQLYDLQHGARAGVGSALMKPTVQRLSVDDMLSLAAYLASLAP